MEFLQITDPSDWPSTMPEMRTIDNLLRCGICQEFITIAMILPDCSHNYCSECIRRYMNYKKQCPTCNSPVMEADLRNNKVLDELVKNFVQVRSQILKLCSESSTSPAATSSKTNTCTPKRAFSIHSTPLCKKDTKRLFLLTLPAKKPYGDGRFPSCMPEKKSAAKVRNALTRNAKAVAVDALSKSFEDDELDDFVDNKRSKTDLLNNSNEENRKPDITENEVIVLDDEDDKVEIAQSEEMKRDNEGTSPLHPASGPMVLSLGTTRSEKADCPVCGVPVPSRHINTHLDRCLSKSAEKEDSKSRTPKRKPLPKLVYNLMSEKELRKKLKEYKLSTQGNKQVLVKRLQEYTVLYNAQCDSSSPVPVEEIVKYLERMERLKTQQPLLSMPAKTFRFKVEKGQSEEEIEKQKETYMKHHNIQFNDLIKTVKHRMTKSKMKKDGNEKGKEAGNNNNEKPQLPSLEEEVLCIPGKTSEVKTSSRDNQTTENADVNQEQVSSENYVASCTKTTPTDSKGEKCSFDEPVLPSLAEEVPSLREEESTCQALGKVEQGPPLQKETSTSSVDFTEGHESVPNGFIDQKEETHPTSSSDEDFLCEKGEVSEDSSKDPKEENRMDSLEVQEKEMDSPEDREASPKFSGRRRRARTEDHCRGDSVTTSTTDIQSSEADVLTANVNTNILAEKSNLRMSSKSRRMNDVASEECINSLPMSNGQGSSDKGDSLLTVMENLDQKQFQFKGEDEGSVSSSGQTEGSGCSMDLFDNGDIDEMQLGATAQSNEKTTSRGKLRRKKKAQLEYLESGEKMVTRASKRLKKSL